MNSLSTIARLNETREKALRDLQRTRETLAQRRHQHQPVATDATPINEDMLDLTGRSLEEVKTVQ